jgi:hypothetical protein
MGCPPEAITDDALYWTYVEQQREVYNTQIAPLVGRNPYVVSNYLAKLYVASEVVTNTLTPEQLKAANAWKVAYLQRLQRENTDDSYINAYLKAWNLTASEVFTEK